MSDEGPEASSLVDNDPAWPEVFDALVARLVPALLWTTATFEHVGSTAVPGLCARNVVDVDVVVTDEDERADVCERLGRLGYRPAGAQQVPGARTLVAPGVGGAAHLLHVVLRGSDAQRDHIRLRDYLRHDAAAARRDGEHKQTLAHLLAAGRTDAYRAARAPVIAQLLSAARCSDAAVVSPAPTLDTDAMVWSSPERTARATQPLVVCLHGFYGVEDDCVPLFDELALERLVAVSLRAPLAIGGRFAWAGRAMDPGYFDDAAQAVLAWLAAVAPTNPVAIIGYSQGGAMALQLLRHAPRRIASVALLAGFVIARPLPGDAELARRRPPVFSGRGREDDVVADFAVTATTEWLATHAELTEKEYPGIGHVLAPSLMRDAAAFVSRHLPD